MRCLHCDSNDWENVDEFRHVPKEMSICKKCGFVSYPKQWKSEEEIKQHYRSNYRNPPTSSNFFTAHRKVHFHAAFLEDVLQKWKDEGKKEPEICEVGAAYGVALNWFKYAYPGAKVSGTELTTSYRRNAWHEFGIELTEEFDDSKKYDMIMSYKVAEHILDVDKHLRKYALCLKDDGLLYISVPIWFGPMTNFGIGGFDLEYYYDTNHINVWTQKIFENILKKSGLEIVKVNHVMYDSTYLCKRNDSLMNEKLEFENVDDIKNRMKKIKKASEHFQKSEHDEAIHEWPNFPAAHASRAELARKQIFEKGWEWCQKHVIDYAINCCPESAHVMNMATDLCLRFEKYKEAIKYCEESLKMVPENETALSQMINILRQLALKDENGNPSDDETRIHYMTQARDVARHIRAISPAKLKDALDLIYLFNAKL